ncbi:HlyD family secretion protein [Phreatobacter oligotrophus]|jgi:membrane fusion protein, multidrug efflux system|uniref:HlyD family secretion protein n=1 Tax=Phreatobacter oligotrophus TaxID=1122261 RepID=UPI0023563BBF|nr:HlyD family secretion protein [Phreatobacter oligotrophus]MBX9989510.1 HlyD family secretion protein [Phreatobacter oligotrophus]
MAETPTTPPAAPGAAAPAPKSRRPARILMLIALAGLSAGGWFGWDWWVNGRFTVSTDDAYVKADTTVLAAKIAGYVTQVVARDNAAVKTGDLLAKIDDGDYRLAVDSAAARVATQDATIQRIQTQVEAQGAAVEQARAQLSAVEADTPRVEAALARAQRLLSQEFTSQAALDTAKADRERNRAQIAQARAAIVGAQAQTAVLKAQLAEAQRTKVELEAALDRARRDLAFTEIRSPIDGVIGNRAVQVGQYVQAGTRLLALVDTSTTYVEANLKETQLARLAIGEPATVAVDAFGGRVLSGRVDSISPSSGAQFALLPPENATGNFTKIVQRIPVRIRLSPEALAEGRLRPGMSVVVTIRTDGGAAPSKVGAVDRRAQPAGEGRALTARSQP